MDHDFNDPAALADTNFHIPLDVWVCIGQRCSCVEDVFALTAICRAAHAARSDPALPAGWIMHNKSTPLHWAMLNYGRIVSPPLFASIVAASEAAHSPLHWAAFRGEVTAVEAQLAAATAQGGCPKLLANITIEEGLAPLHMAAAGGHPGVIQLLVEAGADTEAVSSLCLESGLGCDTGGCMGSVYIPTKPLTAAVLCRRPSAIQALVAAGATDWLCGELSYVHLAALFGDAPVIQALASGGMNLDNSVCQTQLTPLQLAAMHSSHPGAIIRALVDAGADVNYLHAEHNGGHSALHDAAEAGKAATVAALLEAGARPGIRSVHTSTTPLDLAAGKGWLEVVQLLLVAGAAHQLADGLPLPPADMSHPLCSALYWAMSSKQGPAVKVVEALVAAGAPLHELDSTGHTVLHFAVQCGRRAVAALPVLLASGADVNAVTGNAKQQTALHLALRAYMDGRWYDDELQALMKPLLLAGADVTGVKDGSGLSVKALAQDCCCWPLVKALLPRGSTALAADSSSLSESGDDI